MRTERNQVWPLVFALLIALTPLAVEAHGGGHGYGGHRYGASRGHGWSGSRRRAGHYRPYPSPRLPRTVGSWTDPGSGTLDARGRRRRNAAAKATFRLENPCPSTGLSSGTCPGYVIDHVVALKRGGPDAASNMQWQTVDAARAKDRIE